MTKKLFPAVSVIWLITALVLGGGLLSRSQGAEQLKLEVVLVWGTDDTKPPDGKNYKPLDPETRKQLKALKWKNYFEVKRIPVTVTTASPQKVELSEKCSLEVKAFGNSVVEATLFGKGKETIKVKQALPKGEILVPAGNAPNENAWLIILKRLE
jgi:hypothetical protein